MWIALSPQQFEDLNSGRDVQPDIYSGGFGLRTAPAEAVDRAPYFRDWTPDGLKGEHRLLNPTVLAGTCKTRVEDLLGFGFV